MKEESDLYSFITYEEGKLLENLRLIQIKFNL